MKAKEIKTNIEELVDKLDKIESGSGRDPNFLEYKVGEVGKPAKNRIRVIGIFESCRLHYISDYITDQEDVPRAFVCVGRIKCPACDAVSKLYENGTEEAKKRANKLSSTERNYWNCLPRGIPREDIVEPGSRDDDKFVLFPFGATARKAIKKMVEDYGHPGDIENGYDIIFEVEKKSSGWGNDYDVYPFTIRTTEGGKIADIVETTPLTKKELEYDLMDIDPYLQPPDEETLLRIAALFEPGEVKKVERKQLNKSGEEVIDENEVDEPEEEYLCFGASEIYDPKSESCKNCPEIRKCGIEIKKSQKKRREKKSTTPTES